MTRHVKLSALLIALFAYSSVKATFAINTIKPYDRGWLTGLQRKGTFQFGLYGASSHKERGVLCDHTKTCNVLQIWQCNQDALAMVRGFSPDTEIGELAAELSDVPDDGIRGHLNPYADFHFAEAGFGMKYWLPKGFSLGLYVPFMHMELNNVKWCDLTQEVTEADYLTKDLLTDNFCQNVYNLGGQNVCRGWKRRGIGDVSLVGRWERSFPQAKPILTDVLTSLYLGISFPTGKRADESLLFALPFGYDGSPGILFGGTLELKWKHHFVGGVELNMTQLIGDTRCRRIMTDCAQTDLLFLAKTPAYTDWGFLQRYRLYGGASRIIKGFSFDINYVFQKQGNTILSVCNNDYISAFASAAQSLKMWTIHTIGFNVAYDFGYDLCDENRCAPQLSFFWQRDFKGRRAILVNKFGVTFGLTF